jgi:hypothetical protein
VAAGSAVSGDPIVSLYDAADSLPCADFALLARLKRSPEYASIRKRVADAKPVDAWQLNMLNYFLFQLRPLKDVTPFALFTMSWEHDRPISALLITPDAEGKHAQVVNLRQPDTVQTVVLSPEDAAKPQGSASR